MSSTALPALLSLLSFAVLCAPPALALRMLFLRLGRARPQTRMIYAVLCALAVLMLAFNVIVSLGAGAALQAVTPPVVAGNMGTTALLFAWGAFGLCVLLAVIAPHRRRAPLI
jgi:hypothetical protein